MAKNKQCAYWTLVIHEGASCYAKVDNILSDAVNDNPNIQYSYIYHTPDDDCEKNHIHLVLYFRGKVKRFTTIQTMFEGAHIEQTNSQRYKRCIQYLIHKNNPEKKQYMQKEVISNIEISELADIFNSDGYDFELFQEDKLYDYMNEFYSLDGTLTMQKFIDRFGLAAISQYYFIIKDLIKEYINHVTSARVKFEKIDKVEQAFVIYTKDFKQEWQLAKYYGYTDMTYEQALKSMYCQFVDEVEKGFIDCDKIIKEGAES